MSEAIHEIDAGKVRIVALSRDGIWLPVFEFNLDSEKLSDFYRVPFLVKLECAGQIDRPNEQRSMSGMTHDHIMVYILQMCGKLPMPPGVPIRDYFEASFPGLRVGVRRDEVPRPKAQL